MGESSVDELVVGELSVGRIVSGPIVREPNGTPQKMADIDCPHH